MPWLSSGTAILRVSKREYAFERPSSVCTRDSLAAPTTASKTPTLCMLTRVNGIHLKGMRHSALEAAVDRDSRTYIHEEPSLHIGVGDECLAYIELPYRIRKRERHPPKLDSIRGPRLLVGQDVLQIPLNGEGMNQERVDLSHDPRV